MGTKNQEIKKKMKNFRKVKTVQQKIMNLILTK